MSDSMKIRWELCGELTKNPVARAILFLADVMQDINSGSCGGIDVNLRQLAGDTIDVRVSEAKDE